jgi:hypothetical protein
MQPKYLFTIGERKLTAIEKRKLFEAIGRTQPQDKGKRVYLVGDIYQVENNEQRDKRMQSAQANRG